MTPYNKDTSYLSVASLRSIHIVTFLDELNEMELHAGYIGNSYLEAYTNKKYAVLEVWNSESMA